MADEQSKPHLALPSDEQSHTGSMTDPLDTYLGMAVDYDTSKYYHPVHAQQQADLQVVVPGLSTGVVHSQMPGYPPLHSPPRPLQHTQHSQHPSHFPSVSSSTSLMPSTHLSRPASAQFPTFHHNQLFADHPPQEPSPLLHPAPSFSQALQHPQQFPNPFQLLHPLPANHTPYPLQQQQHPQVSNLQQPHHHHYPHHPHHHPSLHQNHTVFSSLERSFHLQQHPQLPPPPSPQQPQQHPPPSVQSSPTAHPLSLPLIAQSLPSSPGWDMAQGYSSEFGFETNSILPQFQPHQLLSNNSNTLHQSELPAPIIHPRHSFSSSSTSSSSIFLQSPRALSFSDFEVRDAVETDAQAQMALLTLESQGITTGLLPMQRTTSVNSSGGGGDRVGLATTIHRLSVGRRKRSKSKSSRKSSSASPGTQGIRDDHPSNGREGDHDNIMPASSSSSIEGSSSSRNTIPPATIPGPSSTSSSSTSTSTPTSVLASRDFQCSQCSKSFIRQYNLNAHIKTHSQERNHACHLCPKSFLRSYDLSRHLRIHSNQKPYRCKICGMIFIRNDAIWRHYRKSHEGHPDVPTSRREARVKRHSI